MKFPKGEIKRNLLGCLEVALFMPAARKRFGNSRDEAIRSFLIPIFLFPLTMGGLYLSPKPDIALESTNLLSLLYSLRTVAIWGLFFGLVYWLVKEIDRREHFYQFIIATNWITLPATVIFLPAALMFLTGSHNWNEIYIFSMCLLFYSYGFTAFMIAHVLRVPWELAGFIMMASLCINDGTFEIISWVGDKL